MKFTNKSEVMMDQSFPVESKFSEKNTFEVLEPSANSRSQNKGRKLFGKRQLHVLLFPQNPKIRSRGPAGTHLKVLMALAGVTARLLSIIFERPTTSWAVSARVWPAGHGQQLFPNIRHWGGHIWTLSPVSGSPVRGRHWCTGVWPAEATKMVGAWRTWWMRLWKMSLFSEKAKGGGSCYHLWPPHRRGQRR